jgi:hypothetical protein
MIRIFSFIKDIFNNNEDCTKLYFGIKKTFCEIKKSKCASWLLKDKVFIAERQYFTATANVYYGIQAKTKIKPEYIKRSKNGIMYLYYKSKDASLVKGLFNGNYKHINNRKFKKKKKNQDNISYLMLWIEQLLFAGNNIKLLRKKWIKENQSNNFNNNRKVNNNNNNNKKNNKLSIIKTFIEINKDKKKIVEKEVGKLIVEQEDEIMADEKNPKIQGFEETFLNNSETNNNGRIKLNKTDVITLDDYKDKNKDERSNVTSEVISLTDDKKISNTVKLIGEVKDKKNSNESVQFIEQVLQFNDFNKNSENNNEDMDNIKFIEAKINNDDLVDNNFKAVKTIKRSRSSSELHTGDSPENKSVFTSNNNGFHKKKLVQTILFPMSNLENNGEDNEKVLNINFNEKERKKKIVKISKKIKIPKSLKNNKGNGG